MEFKAIIDIIEKPLSGEWGVEPRTDNAIKVIRNTNFTNSGFIDYTDVLEREIPNNKILKKKLRFGDILIEKSGGSPNQPVGRVVFYDLKEGSFIYSNFTSCLRPKECIFPKYLFYQLFANHAFKRTLKYQNKTTGILNLQLDRYLKRILVPCPSLPEQKRIAAILDHADAIRRKNREILEKYNLLAQSVFLEMFGDPIHDSKHWGKKKIKETGIVQTGNTPSRKILEYYGHDIEWIKTDNINTQAMYLTKATEYLSEAGKRIGRIVSPGAILVTCIAGSRRVIGNASITDRLVAFNQQINSFTPNEGNSIFYYYNFILTKPYVQSFSTDSMKGMISKRKFEQIEFISPPKELKDQFEDIIIKIEREKLLAQLSHSKSEELFQSLLQRAFRGEL